MAAARRKLSVDELRQALRAKLDVQIIDLRPVEEYSAARIPGSTNCPERTFESISSTLDPSKKTFIICPDGTWGQPFLDQLEAAGFHDAGIVAGGFVAWTTHAYPLISSDNA